MKISERDKMQAWALFAAGALAGIANLSGKSKVEYECDVVAMYADEMLQNMEYTFEHDEDE